MSSSLEEIIRNFEYYRKKIAFYEVLIKTAETQLEERKDEYGDNDILRQRYIRIIDNNKNRLSFYKKTLEKMNDITRNGDYPLEELCSYQYIEDKGSDLEYQLEEFARELQKTAYIGNGSSPDWKQLQQEGIPATEKDKGWFKKFLKPMAIGEYNRIHMVSQLSDPSDNLEILAGSCHIAVEQLSTRVRFVYDDNPDEPVADTYILYWMYGEDKLKDQLATAEIDLDFFQKTKTMLPLGIGLTDEYGYLIQSLEIADLEKKFHDIDIDNATIEIKPNKIYGGWDIRSIAKDLGFFDLKSGNLDPDYAKKTREYLENSWSEWCDSKYIERLLSDYNQIERLGKNKEMPALNAPVRILHSYIRYGYYHGDKEKIEEELSLQDDSYFKSMSTQYFYTDRKYGFFAYPVNRGNFKTKNLIEMAEEDNSPVWSGFVPVSDNEEKEPEAIRLHCTLPEWDRRITKKLDRLNSEIKNLELKVKVHSENLETLSAMRMTAQMHYDFPGGRRDSEEYATNGKLLEEIDKLYAGITDRLVNVDDDAEFIHTSDVEELEAAAEELWKTIKNDDFLEELRLYLKHSNTQNEEGSEPESLLNSGPYMEREPFWGHIFETLKECFVALSKTSLREDIWNTWIEDAFDLISRINDVENLSDEDELISDFDKIILKGKNNIEIKRYTDFGFNKISLEVKYSLNKERERLSGIENDHLHPDNCNPVLWALFQWKKYASGIFHNSPGPQSLVQSLINLYNNEIALKMSRDKGGFEIRFPLALFRLCGISEIDGKRLPFSFLQSIVITGYIASAPDDKKKDYIKSLRRIDGLSKIRVDSETRSVLNSLASDNIIGNTSPDLVSTIYKANSQSWYKIIMQVVTLSYHFHALKTAKDSFDSDNYIESSMKAMLAVSELIYSVGVAHRLLQTMTGFDISRHLLGKESSSALAAMNPEKIAPFIGALAGVLSYFAAIEEYDKGEDAKANIKVAEGSLIILSHALEAVSKRVAQKSSVAAGKSAVTALGYAIPGVNIVLFLLTVYDGYTIYQELTRENLHFIYNHYFDKIKESKVSYTGRKCHDLYEDNLPPDYNKSYNSVFSLSKDIKWLTLSWRAIVPMYLQGYPVAMIEKIVDIGVAPTETTRVYPRHKSADVRLTANVKDIVDFYNHISDPANEGNRFSSGKRYSEVAREMIRGEYIPADGISEELEIKDREGAKIISMDHEYFRNQNAIYGEFWEELNKLSFEKYPANYLT